MRMSVTKEYRALTEKKEAMKKELLSLPKGYISKKNIKGNVQYYLQRREGEKITGYYIRIDEVDGVSASIERRKEIKRQLALIEERLIRLEAAAKLIDNDLYCYLMVYKLSAGMDDLCSREKEKCASFGNAMNAVEGVRASEEVTAGIEAWKSGKRSFLSVFEDTLKRYGFPTEARP